MACRFFLGVAEAMFGQGVALYLTFFYPREKVGFRHGVFVAGAALANVYGGALAYGITQIRGSLAPWKILFIIEGLPTCVFAVAAWFLMPDSVSTAKFLNAREKEIGVHFVARNQRLDTGKESGLRPREMLDGILDPKSWIPGICYFSWYVQSLKAIDLSTPTDPQQQRLIRLAPPLRTNNHPPNRHIRRNREQRPQRSSLPLLLLRHHRLLLALRPLQSPRSFLRDSRISILCRFRHQRQHDENGTEVLCPVPRSPDFCLRRAVVELGCQYTRH